MDGRRLFGRKQGGTNRQSTDRFIPSRSRVGTTFAQHKMLQDLKCEEEDIFAQHRKTWKRSAHIKLMNRMLGPLLPTGPRLLEYGGGERARCRGPPQPEAPWPCYPRKKPLLNPSADYVLDLPSFKKSVYSDVLDWSPDNMLIACLDKKIHLWRYDSQNLRTIHQMNGEITCCKFHPHRALFVVSFSCGLLHLFNVITMKPIAAGQCTCRTYNPEHRCAVTTMAWSPTGKALLTGCTHGRIVAMHASDLDPLLGQRAAHDAAVRAVSIAPSARYAATAGDDRVVRIWKWIMIDLYFEIQYEGMPKCLAWHPWHPSLLAIGAAFRDLDDLTTSLLSVWDIAPRRRVMGATPPRAFAVDYLLFNPFSGELVVAFLIDDLLVQEISYKDPESHIVVMSDESTIVDRISDCQGRIRWMKFSPDGLKLATANAGEDLLIYSFLDRRTRDKLPEQTALKIFSLAEIPILLDLYQYGYSCR